MTTILAVCNGSNAWMVSDCQTSTHYAGIDVGLKYSEHKISKVRKYLIGFAGSVYSCEYFELEFTLDQKQFEDKYGKLYLSEQYKRVKEKQIQFYSNQEEQEFAHVLIATPNNIFEISDEISILKNAHQFNGVTFCGIGSGSVFAEYAFYGQLLLNNKKKLTDSMIEKMISNAMIAATNDTMTSRETESLKI